MHADACALVVVADQLGARVSRRQDQAVVAGQRSNRFDAFPDGLGVVRLPVYSETRPVAG